MSWAAKPLSEILDQSGRDRAGDQDLPVLSITMKHGLVDQADKFKKRVASSDTSNYRIAYKNELVVGFPIDEGVLGFQTKYQAGIVSPAYDIWKLKNKAACHIPYLERYLRSSQARSLYASRMQGAVARRRSMTKTDFLELEVPFPSLDDQIRIAFLLAKVERLIAQRKQHLQQLDNLLKSFFLQMFGDPVRNEKGWPSSDLDSFIDKSRGISYGIVQRGENLPGGVPVLRIRDVISEEYVEDDLVRTHPSNSEKYARTILQGGEVLLSIRGTVGAISVAPSHSIGWNVSRELAIIPVTQGVNKNFLVHLLKSPPMQRHLSSMIKGVAQSGLNLSDVRRISVILPPAGLQFSYEQLAKKIGALIQVYRDSLVNLEALLGALSQQAFKGDLDLSRIEIPQVPPGGSATQESISATEKSAPQTFQLPELPLTFSLSGHQRGAALEYWFNAALEVVPLGDTFRIERLIDAINFRLIMMDDQDREFDVADYEVLKHWTFEALRDGKLAQVFDEESNCIQLKAAHA